MPLAVRSWSDTDKARVLNMIPDCFAISPSAKSPHPARTPDFRVSFGLDNIPEIQLPRTVDPRTVRALAKMIRLMEETVYVMPLPAVQRAKLLVRRFLLGYLWLSHDAISSNVKRYKSRPKPLGITMVHVRWFSFFLCEQSRLHTWWHMFADLNELPLNPRLNSCFGDEDYVRRLLLHRFLTLHHFNSVHQQHHEHQHTCVSWFHRKISICMVPIPGIWMPRCCSTQASCQEVFGSCSDALASELQSREMRKTWAERGLKGLGFQSF